jgi:hypothetical protein
VVRAPIAPADMASRADNPTEFMAWLRARTLGEL